ncbi:hypothetical protein GCM10027202_12260 [Microvirgula curvata]
MTLTANQVKPGPHWVRLTPTADWMLLVIEQPGALLYGLGQAEFVPIRVPGADEPGPELATAQTAANEDTAYNAWFQSKQSTACDGMRQFGKDAWNASAMLAAVPEAPQTIQCNACDWIGSSDDARYLGGRSPLGPLCPECGETTGPADDIISGKGGVA